MVLTGFETQIVHILIPMSGKSWKANLSMPLGRNDWALSPISTSEINEYPMKLMLTPFCPRQITPTNVTSPLSKTGKTKN